jgi:excisionase family DNA binding protein
VVTQKRLLTTIEVSDYLGIPVSTIHRWRYVGTGPPAIRIGRHLRFDPDDLAEWIEEKRERPKQERGQRDAAIGQFDTRTRPRAIAGQQTARISASRYRNRREENTDEW